MLYCKKVNRELNNLITKISNGRIILENEVITGHSLYIKDGVIFAITQNDLDFDKEIDACGNYVSPGFIDLHLHGAADGDFSNASIEQNIAAVNYHCKHGTTSLFPTTLSASFEGLMASLEALKKTKESAQAMPNICGAHLEGPYFSKNQCGAQDPQYIRDPDPEEYAGITQQYGHLIKRWSYAPENPGSEDFQRFLASHGIVGAAGHTDAEYCHVKAAFDLGCKLITHLYSATSTITRKGGFRHLGVIESAYLLDEMDVEAIADGCHLPPLLLQLIYKLKGPEHMCLITDAIRYGGRTDCEAVEIGTASVPYIIEDGVAKLADRSAFAGSIATADALIRTCVEKAGIPLWAAVKMLTQVPARIMGLAQKGQLKEGFDADLVIFDDQIQIKSVIIGGQIKI